MRLNKSRNRAAGTIWGGSTSRSRKTENEDTLRSAIASAGLSRKRPISADGVRAFHQPSEYIVMTLDDKVKNVPLLVECSSRPRTRLTSSKCGNAKKEGPGAIDRGAFYVLRLSLTASPSAASSQPHLVTTTHWDHLLCFRASPAAFLVPHPAGGLGSVVPRSHDPYVGSLPRIAERNQATLSGNRARLAPGKVPLRVRKTIPACERSSSRSRPDCDREPSR
jgi:hypothetical protein